MHGEQSGADDATEFVGRSPDPGDAGPLEPGVRLGPYVVRRLLGEGGMGRVYLAEQLRPVHREVALKLMREQVAGPLARAYFDVERQALAQMQHPAIAQVFDAGTTEQGYPYFAMEVVDGEPVTRFCRDESLPLDERLALFARICRGLQHAHQKGIIHRDIKPANILVRRIDGVPSPKIIDFGIAIGDDGGEAVAAERAGTSLYMSPEQALPGRGIDTRSDVYSLGVVLYELLTGGDAASLESGAHHSSRARQTLLAAIDSDAAPAADWTGSSALLEAARRLPGELRAILRKALATDRDDRYESAAALADDIERYRADRPVKAMPPSRWYLSRKFVARHRLGLVATVLVALALVVGTLLALRGLALARQEAAKAERVSEFVRSMLAGIDPDRAKGMDRSLMRVVLDSAADRVGRELAGQPDVRADIERTIAASYSSLGEFELADAHFDAAVAAARAARLPPAESADIASARAISLNAGKHSRDALAAAQQAFKLVADLPADDRRRLLVENRLATIERDAGKLDAARARYTRVIEARTRVLGADDEATLDSIQGLAVAHSIAGQFDDARPLLQGLLAKYRARLGPEDVKTISATLSLAMLENESERYGESVRLLQPLLPIAEKVYGKDHPRTLVVVMNLGSALRYENRYDEARPYYLRALELARTLYGDTAQRTLMAEGNLSLMLRDAGDLVEAEKHARFVADNAEAAFGDNPYRAAMYRGLATVLIRMGRYDDAERELDRAWSVFTEASGYGAAHPRAQEVVDSYVELYDAWGKPEKKDAWVARRVAPPAEG